MRQLCLCLMVALPATSSIAATYASHAPATVWTVTSCNDGDAGSLRDIIENPAKAQSGDSINLSGLPAVCGMASVITLLNGEIHVAQNDLELYGPDPAFGMGTVAISGGGASGIFNHTGSGTMSIHALTLQDGYVHDPVGAAGGCILSTGNIELDQGRVINCAARTDNGLARGGGICAVGHVKLVDSIVSGNKAIGSAHPGVGGGIFSGDLLAKYSSINHNASYDSANGDGIGGGAAAYGMVGVYHSTIDHNMSRKGSAFWSNSATHISNSTISGNEGGASAVSVEYDVSASLEIANSTIAFNHLINGVHVGAVSFFGLPSDTVSLYSSIIAKNTVGNTASDLYLAPGHGNLSGADNLVIATNIVPPPNVITIIADPKLGPLQLNGGPLLTHALLAGSPAIGHGNVDVTFTNDTNANDERGPGYPRTTGNAASVDMGAFQFDRIFFDNFD